LFKSNNEINKKQIPYYNMNLTTNYSVKSSLDPCKPFRQLAAHLRRDQLANLSHHSRENSQVSIKTTNKHSNILANFDSQRNSSAIKTPLLLKDCFNSDLEELRREIDTSYSLTQKCVSIRMLRKIFTFLEFHFSGLDDFRKLIEVLFESVFDNSYSQFLSQLDFKDKPDNPSKQNKPRNSTRGFFIPRRSVNRYYDINAPRHPGRNKTIDNKFDSSHVNFQSHFRPELKERLQFIKKNWVSGPRSVLSSIQTPTNRLSETLKFPPVSTPFKKAGIEKLLLEKSFVSTRDQELCDTNILTFQTIRQTCQDEKYSLTIPGDKSRVNQANEDSQEKIPKAHDQFKLSVLSKSNSQNYGDSELELNDPINLNTSGYKSKVPIVLISYKQEIDRLNSKINELEDQLISKKTQLDTSKSRSTKAKTQVGPSGGSPSNFKDHASIISSMIESRNSQFQDTRLHIALLKKHNQQASLTIIKLQKAQVLIEKELAEYKFNYQELNHKMDKLKNQYSALKQKARDSSQFMTTITSKIMEELTIMTDLMASDSSNTPPYDPQSTFDADSPKIGEVNSKFYSNVRSKFHPQTPNIYMFNSGNKGDDYLLSKSHNNRENLTANPLGSVWHNSIISSIDEIQHSLCMNCAVQSLDRFKTILGLTNRLQLMIKGDQLEISNESWHHRFRLKVDSLIQSVHQFCELFKTKYAVPTSAKLIY